MVCRAVEGEKQLIVATEVSSNASDQGRLVPLVDAVDAARHPAKARMAEKLATSAGRVQYARRKWLSEAPNGWIKEVLGFRRFSLRGLNKVQGEWNLVCLALNVKRMQGLQAA